MPINLAQATSMSQSIFKGELSGEQIQQRANNSLCISCGRRRDEVEHLVDIGVHHSTIFYECLGCVQSRKQEV